MQRTPEDFADRSVCVLGLGYVGLTLATVMAEVGFRVAGVEIRDEVLAGLPHFHDFWNNFDARDLEAIASLRYIASHALTSLAERVKSPCQRKY